MHRYLNINQLLADTYGLWLKEQNQGTFISAENLEETVCIAQKMSGPAPYGMPRPIPSHKITAINVVVDGKISPTVVFNISLIDFIQAAVEKTPVAPDTENSDKDPLPYRVGNFSGYDPDAVARMTQPFS